MCGLKFDIYSHTQLHIKMYEVCITIDTSLKELCTVNSLWETEEVLKVVKYTKWLISYSYNMV